MTAVNLSGTLVIPVLVFPIFCFCTVNYLSGKDYFFFLRAVVRQLFLFLEILGVDWHCEMGKYFGIVHYPFWSYGSPLVLW